jgi:hypothetical protein
LLISDHNLSMEYWSSQLRDLWTSVSSQGIFGVESGVKVLENEIEQHPRFASKFLELLSEIQNRIFYSGSSTFRLVPLSLAFVKCSTF